MSHFLKPTKIKIISMIIVWLSIWLAGELNDFIGDPIIKRVAPQLFEIVDSTVNKVNELSESDDLSIIMAQFIIKGIDIFTCLIVSYFSACTIIFLMNRQNSPNQRVNSSGYK